MFCIQLRFAIEGDIRAQIVFFRQMSYLPYQRMAFWPSVDRHQAQVCTSVTENLAETRCFGRLYCHTRWDYDSPNDWAHDRGLSRFLFIWSLSNNL